MYNDILLPVETASRELDAKLLLGLFAAEAGFRCHIGMMRQLHAPGYPPSIYISKSVRFGKALQTVAAFGHTVVAWDEEGLVR
jgi:surface carbohydrate biosynthesis protein